MRRRRSGLNFGRQKKKVNMSVVKEVCVWIIEIAITLLVAFTLVYFVGLRTSVVGQSMAETLNGGDEILVNRFIYKVTDPRPNDVIVFLPNGNEKSHYYRHSREQGCYLEERHPRAAGYQDPQSRAPHLV